MDPFPVRVDEVFGDPHEIVPFAGDGFDPLEEPLRDLAKADAMFDKPSQLRVTDCPRFGE
jgi:hypothetical protein